METGFRQYLENMEGTPFIEEARTEDNKVVQLYRKNDRIIFGEFLFIL